MSTRSLLQGALSDVRRRRSTFTKAKFNLFDLQGPAFRAARLNKDLLGLPAKEGEDPEANVGFLSRLDPKMHIRNLKDPVTFQEKHGLLQSFAAGQPLGGGVAVLRAFGIKGKGGEKPVSPGFSVARLANRVPGEAGKQLRTILGQDPEHVFKEKRRLNRQIAANPHAAAAIFETGESAFFGGGSFSGKLGTMRALSQKALAGTLSDREAEWIEKQSRFGERHGAFNRFLGRQAGIIAQREAVEQARRRSPGRTQTILTTTR